MTILEQDFAEYPDLRQFLDFVSDSVLLRGSINNIDSLFNKYGKNYLRFAEDILRAAKKIDINPTAVFESYIYEYLRDLARFEQTGEYNNGTFEEIRERIYDNKELMGETYLPGLFVSYGFASQLYEKYKCFERSFLPRLHKSMNGIEIGFGDGFYLWCILKAIPDIKVSGLDISQHALDFTVKLLRSSGFSPNRFDLRLGNLCNRLSLADESQDWCILSEVIEHVADPVFSLQEIVRIMKKSGVFFMTTVIDANHMDHITNFESPEVVADLLESAGFGIMDSLVYEASKEIKGLRDRSIGLAYVCCKV